MGAIRNVLAGVGAGVIIGLAAWWAVDRWGIGPLAAWLIISGAVGAVAAALWVAMRYRWQSEGRDQAPHSHTHVQTTASATTEVPDPVQHVLENLIGAFMGLGLVLSGLVLPPLVEGPDQIILGLASLLALIGSLTAALYLIELFHDTSGVIGTRLQSVMHAGRPLAALTAGVFFNHHWRDGRADRVV